MRTLCKQMASGAPSFGAERAGSEQRVSVSVPPSRCPNSTGPKNVEKSRLVKGQRLEPASPLQMAGSFKIEGFQPLSIQTSGRDRVEDLEPGGLAQNVSAVGSVSAEDTWPSARGLGSPPSELEKTGIALGQSSSTSFNVKLIRVTR